MLVDVVEVRALSGHWLHVRFADGVEGEIDLDGIVHWEGVFAPLVEPERFAEVRVDPELGTVVWPNGADIDPDVLYAAVTGRSIELPKAAAQR
ncbi:MAG: DUF2442 domain-containing protein [Acidobacteria bacterium]|jgi:hypothetical protein|nr:DUF2442 domain-containing protein [Acidobacteriota bacterium]